MKYIVTIPTYTDIDPSQLLDIAQMFHKLVTEQTSEPCSVEDDEVSVEEV